MRTGLKMKAALLAATLPLAVATALAQSGSAAAPAAGASSKTPVLTRAQLDELIAKPGKLLIVDVRRPDELTSIGGFPAYFSVQAADLEKSLEWIPKDRRIVTVSNHAGRAVRAADLLTAKGFKVVGSVGAQNYEEAGGKLTRIAAPAPPPSPGPTLDVATRLAQVAVDQCAAKGFNVGVSVVDSGGVLKALLAKDGTSPRGVQSSTNKAITALTFGDATSQIGERAKTEKVLADRLAANPNFNARAGGVLLKVNGDVIGAIGVGGARGSENDEACALAAIEAVQK
jgi:uncharacterized protein GlcG (DUF336 family)/rhodanese-related sulfurtransferase